MSWGAMMGLGQSLQGVGDMLLDHNKSKMREQLEREREDRAEQRQLDKEARDAASFKESVPELRDGVWMMVDYSKGGKVIDTKLAPQHIIQQMERQEQLHDLEVQDKESSIESRLLKSDIDKFKVGTLEEDWNLTRREREARIGASNASIRERDARAAAAAARSARPEAGGEGTVKPDAQLVTELVELESDLVEEYMTKHKLSRAEVNRLAHHAIRAAREKNKDPIDTFRRTLNTAPGMRDRARNN